jgi:hypothetical protein
VGENRSSETGAHDVAFYQHALCACFWNRVSKEPVNNGVLAYAMRFQKQARNIVLFITRSDLFPDSSLEAFISN